MEYMYKQDSSKEVEIELTLEQMTDIKIWLNAYVGYIPDMKDIKNIHLVKLKRI